MLELPTGTVTFLFTDIEESTTLWEQHPAAARTALVRHDALVEQVVTEHDGHLVRPRGEGDSRFAVFARATDAVAAAAALQQALFAEPWPTPTPLRVRMALHTGEADLREGDYYGSAVNRCARLRAVAHGGQTLVSLATQELARDSLPADGALLDLGAHRLKDLLRPERIFQLLATGLPTDFAPLTSLDARPHNLLLQRDPLIGREREVAEVVALLGKPESGLVTLTGPGGTGKTRLSLQVAAELLDDYADGAWFVDLSPISDPALVPSTIAGILGVMETPGQPIVQTLTIYLRPRQLLLVLDNFEQVIGAASLAAELLRAAPRLKLLVTSRSVLHLSSEQEYSVPPLACPDPGHLPPLDALGQYAAVTLFIQRALAVKPDFRLSAENAPAVAAICARLDGLPLAIRLAAARIKLFPPQALQARLDHRLKVLTGGSRDVPERQQTLRGAIDWSYRLLTANEQTIFARLAVFVGGWTLEAAEAMCMADPAPAIDVFDGLSSLIDNSLVRQDESADGEPRFRMLETIREYALERLEATDLAEVMCEQHALYFLSLAEEADLAGRELDLPAQHLWHRLEAEHDNLRAALAWTCSKEPRLALRLAGAIEAFWTDRGLFREGDTWLERALASADPSLHRAERARALLTAGGLAWYRGAFVRSSERAEEALAHYRELGDLWGIASALFSLGGGARMLGEYARAETLLQESLSLFREIHNGRGVGWCLLVLGDAVLDQGDATRAAPYIADGLFVFRRSGYHIGVATAIKIQGRLAFIQGDTVRATTLIEESLTLARDTDEIPENTTGMLIGLGHIAHAQGDHPRAAQLYRESLELLRHDFEDYVGLCECLEALAGIAVADASGDSRRAPRLFGAAEALRAVVNAPLPPVAHADYQRDVAAAHSQLDEGSWAAAWAEGSAMTLEQAIAYALEDAPDA